MTIGLQNCPICTEEIQNAANMATAGRKVPAS